MISINYSCLLIKNTLFNNLNRIKVIIKNDPEESKCKKVNGANECVTFLVRESDQSV